MRAMPEVITPEEARDRLRHVKLLSVVDTPSLDDLAKRLTWRRVKIGEEVVSHLDRGTQVFFAVEGTFNAKLQTAVGRQVAIRQLLPGSHFGEIAALTETPRSLGIVAETDGLIAECPADAFRNLMDRSSAFATAVAAHLARNVVALTDRVFELATLEMRFRVYAELLRLSAAGERLEHGIAIRNAPTHEAIAATVGAQREAVNRELRALATNGVIRQSRREILILKVEWLRDELRRRAGATTSDAVDWRL